MANDCPRNNSLIVSFPNPTNCSRYYQCENGTKTDMTCPFQQQYNPLLRVCDDPRYAGCKENGSLHRSMPPLFHSQNNSNTTQSPYTSLKPQTESQTTKSIVSDSNNTQVVAGNDTFRYISNSTLIPNGNSTVNTSSVAPSSALPSNVNVQSSTIKSTPKEHAHVVSSSVSNGTLVVRNNSASTNEVKQENLLGRSTPPTTDIKNPKEELAANGENVEVNDDENTSESSEDYDDSIENNNHEQSGNKKPK